MSLITSAQNSIVKHLLKLQKEPSYRQECQALFLEGKKVVLEAVEKLSVNHCILEEGLTLESPFPTTYLAPHLVEKISSLKNGEGYFAEVKRPQNALLHGLKKLLVLDGLQNPGNMGTLIRTALAFGFEGIFILEGSVDPYCPKVIRASMGACLYIPIQCGTHTDLQQLAQLNQMTLYVGDSSGTPIDKASIKKPFMLVLGNESKGSQLKMNPNIQKVSLPIDSVDSLNVAVAGSLLMYLVKGSS